MNSSHSIPANPDKAMPENGPSVDKIATSLCDFLRENILAPEVEVTPNTELSLIGIDSYSLMELILFIERRYGLILPVEMLTPENTATVYALGYCCNHLLQKT